MHHQKRLLLLALLASFSAARASTITREQILDEAQKVADAQLKALGEKVSTDWTWGVMEVGYTDFSHVASNGPRYTQALTKLTNKSGWKLHVSAKSPFNADDFCIGQTYLDLNIAQPDASHLAPLTARMDLLVDHINHPTDPAKLTFWWCDSLFMAPPTMTRMSVLIGDRKYIDAMDNEFWRNTDLLYDKQEHLYYRDARFLNRTDANGKKIFWSRGNGWVLAGIAQVLQFMPRDYPTRSRYEKLLKEMCARLSKLQSSDGTWPSSLIDPQLFGDSETSGTALMTFAMAWGINNNLLDRETYLPTVTHAWVALLTDRRADGLPGHAQRVGDQPATVPSDSTQVYATGGYLLAATELLKLAPLSVAEKFSATAASSR